MRLLRVVLCKYYHQATPYPQIAAAAWRQLGGSLAAASPITNSMGLAFVGFLVFGGLKGIPPFGQSFPHPRYSKYIATHTENTKNPKNTW